jgi:hypothetical protein
LEVLLYAAHLQQHSIGVVADWSATADADDTARPVLAALITAEEAGDESADREPTRPHVTGCMVRGQRTN